jgi:hypothetical protein
MCEGEETLGFSFSIPFSGTLSETGGGTASENEDRGGCCWTAIVVACFANGRGGCLDRCIISCVNASS